MQRSSLFIRTRILAIIGSRSSGFSPNSITRPQGRSWMELSRWRSWSAQEQSRIWQTAATATRSGEGVSNMKTVEADVTIAQPETQFVPLSVPEIRGNEWAYVKECLDTGWVSSVGSYVERFEAEMARATGTRFAVATVNGTAALHTALLVAGVRPDDEVLVSTLTFIAPANAIRYVGAWPVFIDAEPVTGQMDPARVAEFLTRACRRQDG